MTTLVGCFTHRLNDTLWSFKSSVPLPQSTNKPVAKKNKFVDSDDEDDSTLGLIIACPFEPVLLLLEYTIDCNTPRGNNIYYLKEVQKVKKVPWSAIVARALGVNNFKNGESYIDYQNRCGPIQNPLVKGLMWLHWNKINYVRTLRGVSLSNTEELQRICTRVTEIVKAEKLIISHDSAEKTMRSIACDTTVYIYSDLLVNMPSETQQTFTLIQEMKDVMKRTMQWQVKDSDLGRMVDRMTPFKQKLNSSMYPLKRDKTTKSFEFTTSAKVELKPDEPVDLLVDSCVRWTNPHPSPKRQIHFYSSGDPVARETATRLEVHQTAYLHQELRKLADERDWLKIICVFDGYGGGRSWYESQKALGRNFRAVMKRETSTPQIKWVRKANDSAYEIGEKELTENVFWERYKSQQTLGLEEIYKIQKAGADAVFFFGKKSIPFRWLQWCDACCSKKTVLVLVGAAPASF
jgi:hypothetical protein